jgi:hypothetical protein
MPKFGPGPAAVACDQKDCCLRVRSGSSAGILSPPAPRGSAGPAQVSAYGSIPNASWAGQAGLFFAADREIFTESLPGVSRREQRNGDGGAALPGRLI